VLTLPVSTSFNNDRACLFYNRDCLITYFYAIQACRAKFNEISLNIYAYCYIFHRKINITCIINDLIEILVFQYMNEPHINICIKIYTVIYVFDCSASAIYNSWPCHWLQAFWSGCCMFHTYVATICSKRFICCSLPFQHVFLRCKLQVFYLDVAYVFTHMLQVHALDVSYVVFMLHVFYVVRRVKGHGGLMVAQHGRQGMGTTRLGPAVW
jgi:hypothetical protein